MDSDVTYVQLLFLASVFSGEKLAGLWSGVLFWVVYVIFKEESSFNTP